MEKVFDLIKKHPMQTTAEIAEIGSLDRHLVAKRASDLSDAGRVDSTKELKYMRKCRVSNKTVMLWHVKGYSKENAEVVRAKATLRTYPVGHIERDKIKKQYNI